MTGVSVATVSYVINNKSGEVSPATREKVMRAVRDAGYRPSARQVRTRTLRSNNIGVIINRPKTRGLREQDFFLETIDGIIASAARLSFATTIFTIEQWADVHTSLRNRVDGRCDGLLFIGPPTENEIVPALVERGVPIVLLYGNSTLPNVHMVTSDDLMGVKAAVAHLVAQGHTRIAHIHGALGFYSSDTRLLGYRDGLREAGIEYDPAIIFGHGYDYKTGYNSTCDLIDMPSPQRPTAVICANDLVALGSVDAVRSRGMSVPDDLSIIGIDDIKLAATSDPPLTTIRQPLGEIGQRAVEILNGLIIGEEPQTIEELLPMELIIRSTTSPKR